MPLNHTRIFLKLYSKNYRRRSRKLVIKELPKQRKEKKGEKTFREARLLFLGSIIAKPNPVSYEISYGIGILSFHDRGGGHLPTAQLNTSN